MLPGTVRAAWANGAAAGPQVDHLGAADCGGKMEAYAALTSNPVYFARWFAPDHPEVYADDPDALALLQAIGADPVTVMASEI